MNQTPIVEEANPNPQTGFGDSESPQQDEKSRFSLPSISTRQLLILAAIMMIAIIIWRTSLGRTTEEENREIVEDESIEGIHVPENPEDPLRADSAVITGLKEAGVMG